MISASLVGFPIYTLTRFRGMALSPPALRGLGLVAMLERESLKITDVGDIKLQKLSQDSGPKKFRNSMHMAEWTERIRRAAGQASEREFAIFLGGECSLVLGSLSGMKGRRRGRAGILWMDAHGDFNTPETTPSGFIGGMCLALACGRGPPLSQETEDSGGPLLEEDAVVHLGSRALDRLEEIAMKESEIMLVSAKELRKGGAAVYGRRAARLLSDRCDWCVLHIDLDVIDPREMPAVNFLEPNGISTEDVLLAARGLKETGMLKAVEFTSYDPLTDANRSCGRRVVNLISRLSG
ncbi:MAG TPA: arginase family protein [Nitrososphaerales archaeon]|nr:arginase family protein [Nitrososphaerales archaeon]